MSPMSSSRVRPAAPLEVGGAKLCCRRSVVFEDTLGCLGTVVVVFSFSSPEFGLQVCVEVLGIACGQIGAGVGLRGMMCSASRFARMMKCQMNKHSGEIENLPLERYR